MCNFTFRGSASSCTVLPCSAIHYSHRLLINRLAWQCSLFYAYLGLAVMDSLTPKCTVYSNTLKFQHTIHKNNLNLLNHVIQDRTSSVQENVYIQAYLHKVLLMTNQNTAEPTLFTNMQDDKVHILILHPISLYTHTDSVNSQLLNSP